MSALAVNGTASFPANLTFAYFADQKKYLKAFCLNPPAEVCPFKPCPNADITGIGQIISMYVTTIMYALVLTYIPNMQRAMFYVYMSVIYSLLIAGLISILKSELTKSDGIFVLVSIASPATLFLWFLTIRSCWNPLRLPMIPGDPNKSKLESKEVHLVRILGLGSMVFTIVLIFLIFLPTSGIKFAQPACNKDYGTELWYNLAWELPFTLQWVVMTIWYFISLGVVWAWTSRRKYEVATPALTVAFGQATASERIQGRKRQVDLISWTEQILYEQYPKFMNPTLSSAICLALQVSGLPDFKITAYTKRYAQYLYTFNSKDMFAFVIITYGLFRRQPKPDTNWAQQYAIRFAISSFLAAIVVLRMLVHPLIPVGMDWILLFISCTAAAWSYGYFWETDMKFFLPTFLVISGVITCFVNIFAVIIGDSKAFSSGHTAHPDGNEVSYFELNTISMVSWIVAWLATSAWPWRRTLTWDKLNLGLWRRGHLLKLCWLIINPIIMWIQATNNSSPSPSLDMSFGQIFSLIVAIVTLLTMVDEARVVTRAQWAALFFSNPMPLDSEEEPDHTLKDLQIPPQSRPVVGRARMR